MAHSGSITSQRIKEELERHPAQILKFGNPAKSGIRELSDEYFYTISFLAIQHARRSQGEIVTADHVRAADRQMQVPAVRVGWWSRTLFAIAGGSASASISSIVGLITKEDLHSTPVVEVLPAILIAVVCGLLALSLAALAFFSEAWGRR